MPTLANLELERDRIALELAKINELQGDDYNAEAQEKESKLLTEHRSLLQRIATARIAQEKDPDHADLGEAEGRELAEHLNEFNVGNVFAACYEQRSTEGREAELQQHYGLGAHVIPNALLERRAVTPAPTDTEANQQMIVQPVFVPAGVKDWFDEASVPSGDAVFPTLTTRPTVSGPHKDSTDVAETTGAFTAATEAPGRFQASFFYRESDAARFAGMGEALRVALVEGLAEDEEKQAVAAVIAAVSRTAASAADTFASYLSKLCYARLDGRQASMPSDIRIAEGAATLAHQASVLQTATGISAAERLRELVSGLRVNAFIPAATGNKQDALVRLGMRRDAVIARWGGGVNLLVDPYSRRGQGEVEISAYQLAAVKVTRAAGFARIETQHA